MNSPSSLSQAHDPTTPAPRPDQTFRRRVARRRGWLIWLPVVLLLGGGAAFGGWQLWRGPGAAFNAPTHVVARERLQVAIVERGALESAENSDVVCRVKAGKKGTSGIIKWVIDDGTQVEKGQKLIEIDDSALKEDLNDQSNKVNKARADWISAKEFCAITESQNFSDIESAKTTRVLAEIELRKFLGDFIAEKVLPLATRAELQRYLQTQLDQDVARQLDEPGGKSISDILQSLSDMEGKIELAKSDRETMADRVSWSQRMVKKGLLSRSQADSDKSKLDGMMFTLKKTQLEYELFRKYTIDLKLTELWSKVKEADRLLERVKSQADSKRNTAEADLASKKALYEQELDRKGDIEAEIAKCVIHSPQEGLVVYYIPEQSRFGSGSQQSTVAQGEPVREGQKLMRIPNLNRMLVNTRVHEAMVGKIKGEVNRPTGFGDAIRAAFSVGRLPLELAVNHLAYQEKLRDQFRDKEFDTLYPGQRAFIRIDANPGSIFKGHVRSVATVASQGDWMSSDVKVYQTMVSIDDTVSNLKPGMSAEVTILAEESTENVLTIPIQSVVGSIAMGAKRKCFVVEEGRPKERDIVVGLSNDKLVEVKNGLNEGERVVLNPRALLGDKSGMKVGTPSTRRGVDADEIGGGAKKGGKKGGMKGANPDGPPGGFGPGGAAQPGVGAGKQFNRPEDAKGKKS